METTLYATLKKENEELRARIEALEKIVQSHDELLTHLTGQTKLDPKGHIQFANGMW